MSQWTHVSGIFRIDGLPQLGAVPDIEAIFGKPGTREFIKDYPYRVDGERIPVGSEGSLQYEVVKAGDGLVYLTIAVWGDLRDFGPEDVHQIDEWFGRIVHAAHPDEIKRTKLMIRSAHLVVEIEYGINYLLRYRYLHGGGGTVEKLLLEPGDD